jgi:hypothetical protein
MQNEPKRTIRMNKKSESLSLTLCVTLECGSCDPAFQGVPDISWFIIRDAIQREPKSTGNFQIYLIRFFLKKVPRVSVIPVKTGIQNLRRTGFLLSQE